MDRRRFLYLLVPGGAAVAAGSGLLLNTSAYRAQQTPPWKAVLVSDDEPGTPLIVSGTAYAPDGETPVAGVHVHVYNTDAEGLYAPPGSPEGTHRIQGDLRTSAEGHYEFRTVKPGSYPGSRVPAHIHYRVSGAGYPEQWFNLRFEGDPHLSRSARAEEERKGRFGAIQPLTKGADGPLRCTFDLRLER